MLAAVKPWRVIVKAILIFCVLNFAFIYLDPWLSTHQVYNHLIPGRLRFPWAQPESELIAHSLSIYDDMDAMFASQLIAGGGKAPDEFRVLFLGDSSIWGDGISTSETLPGQINTLGLRTCRNQRIVAYNLALPSLYVMKDLLILNKGLKYEPDLIVLGVTLRSLVYSDQNASQFLPSQSDEALALINRYRLNIPVGGLMPKTPLDQTILADHANIKNLLILQMDAIPWIATGVDGRLTTDLQSRSGNDIDPKNKYMLHGSTLNPESLMFDVLRSADELVRPAPILIINEPIFIATGRNSQQYYDAFYTRSLYDQYRRILGEWAVENHQLYFDAWNSIPGSEFTDTPLHLSANGEKQLASLLSPLILKLSCSN